MQAQTSFDAASLLVASAGRRGNKVAIRSGDESLTYANLLDRTTRLAAGLRSLGVATGDRVALLLPNGARFVEAWWAIIMAGAVVVPVNPRTAREELRFYLEDSGAGCVVVDAAHLETVRALGASASTRQQKIVCLDSAVSGVENYEALIARSPASEERPVRTVMHPCAIYYTAGSTGRPKGVVRSHLSVAWGLAMLAQRLSADDVLLGRAPMAHTGGSLTGPFAVLIAGGTLIIPGQTDANALLELVKRHHVTRFYLHPVLNAKAIFAAIDRGSFDLSSLRRLQWTAGFLPEAIRAEIFRRFPGLPLEVTYGMTEVSNIATYECDEASALPSNCVGYAWPGSEVALLGDSGEFLPSGADEGEVVVRSPTAMSGYWNAPELTAAAMHDGWIRTGDLGRVGADGALFLTGRIKDVIKTAGMTVHAAEIEHALAAHAEVVDAAAFALPHPHWEEAVTAVVARRAASSLSEADLIEHCRAHLNSYKLPKRIFFLSELPRNASNKVDKRALIAKFAAQAEPDRQPGDLIA